MRSFLISVSLACICSPVACAQAAALSELVPATTLAYAELREPAVLAATLEKIVAASKFQDGLKLLHDRRDTAQGARLPQGNSLLSLCASAFSKSMLDQFAMIQGLAVAWTGMTPEHDPKFVLIVQLGDSPVANFLAQAKLIHDSTLRRVSTIDQIPIFQHRTPPSVTFDPTTGQIGTSPAKPAVAGPQEPTYAYIPGLFLIGSNTEAIHDVLIRYRDRTAKPAQHANLKALDGWNPPGIHLLIRPAEIVRVCDLARKAQHDLCDPEVLACAKLVINPASIPLVSGRLTLDSETLTLTIEATRDEKQPSLLFDTLLSGLDNRNSRFLPHDSPLFLSVGLPPPQQRRTSLLRLADAIFKVQGDVGPIPSEWIPEHIPPAQLQRVIL